MIKLFLTLILFSAISVSSLAQTSGDYEYSRETIWGIVKATNSGLIGGFMLKHNRMIKKNHFHGVAMEIVNVKHPQEKRQRDNRTNSSYILGKENYLYSIRMSYSREIVLFRKAPQQGVQINLIGQAGPTIGLEVPYYVEILEQGKTSKVPYTSDLKSEIIGPGNIFQGLPEAKVVPGLNIKAALAFEFGAFKSNVVGIETGFQCDFFTREIILIPTVDNKSAYPNAYFTLFYGGRK